MLIRDAAERLKIRTAFVDITGSASSQYLAEHNLKPEQVVRYLTSKSVHQYRLSTTPQLLLLDADGRVQRVWTGGMTDPEVKEASTLLEEAAQ